MSDPGDSNIEQQMQQLPQTKQDSDMFIGNLRPDMAPRIIMAHLQQLFHPEGVTVQEDHLHIVNKGAKKPKYAFLTLSSPEEKTLLIDRFDGMHGLSFVVTGKPLRLANKFHKPKETRVVIDFPSQLPPLKLNKQSRQGFAPLTNPFMQGSQSAPAISPRPTDSFNVKNIKELYLGQILRTENRITEYKRGGGNYLHMKLIHHVRKYVCAFLNSEGGMLMIGVSDDGKVHGVPCNRKQEDTARCQIDNVIKRFQPHVFPNIYSVDFVAVYDRKAAQLKSSDQPLKVIVVTVNIPPGNTESLYETDRGEVYIRRDGSVQGPLKASQIMEWCRLRYIMENMDQETVVKSEEYKEENRDMSYSSSEEDLSSNHSSQNAELQRKAVELQEKEKELQKMEEAIKFRQAEIEQQICTMKGHFELREKRLKDELEKSREKSERTHHRRPKSAVCTIF